MAPLIVSELENIPTHAMFEFIIFLAIMAYAQRIRGARGGELLFYNRFIYKINRRNKNGKDYYNCNAPNCHAKLLTLMNDLGVQRNHGVHGHPPPNDIVASAQILEEAKTRIDGDPTKGVPKIWEEVLDWFEQNHNYNGDLPEFVEFKSTLYRKRAESLPPLPVDAHGIDFRALDPVRRNTVSSETRCELGHHNFLYC